MAHLNNEKTTRAEATSYEWLAVGSQIGDLANQWALRNDIVAYVGPGAGGPAPACFSPMLAEIEVNVNAAFGKGVDPERLATEDLRNRSVQFDYPKAVGAIYHEALHARFSRWSLVEAMSDLTSEEYQAINLLEESRIEAAGVEAMPGNRSFLRACALEIVVADAGDDLDKLTSTAAAAHLAALTLARVDAGVLQRSDVEAIADVLEVFLGEELLTKLRSIWNRFQMHDNHYVASPNLYDLAREWVETVKDAQKERGEKTQEEQDAETKKLIEEMMDALSEAADAAAIGSAGELADQQTAEEWAEIVGTKSMASKEKAANKKTADDVFSKGTGPMPGQSTGSRLMEKRQPTTPERAAAVKVAQMLEKAKYRERSLTEINSVIPPGRLRTRAVVQGAALKAKGVMNDTEPWRRNVRRHTDDPTLTIGVMVDISGSMSAAMEPMAVTAWVMSEAAKRVQARAAMVYYGQDVFPTLKPGQHLDQVHVYTAPDGTEKFNKAFKALDGGLNLLNGSGARLLVVVSDGCYTPDEIEHAERWVKRCQAEGVAVLWLPFDRSSYAKRITRGTDAVVLEGTLDPAAAAIEIGQAAARALEKTTARNAA